MGPTFPAKATKVYFRIIKKSDSSWILSVKTKRTPILCIPNDILEEKKMIIPGQKLAISVRVV